MGRSHRASASGHPDGKSRVSKRCWFASRSLPTSDDAATFGALALAAKARMRAGAENTIDVSRHGSNGVRHLPVSLAFGCRCAREISIKIRAARVLGPALGLRHGRAAGGAASGCIAAVCSSEVGRHSRSGFNTQRDVDLPPVRIHLAKPQCPAMANAKIPPGKLSFLRLY